MKKMIMCLLISALVVNVAMADRTDNAFLKAAAVLSGGWTSLGLGGLGVNLELKFRASQQPTDKAQYAETLLKRARISRGIGFLGMVPLVSTWVGTSIGAIGYKLKPDGVVHNMGAVALLPAAAMVILPAIVCADYQAKKS